MNSAWDRPFQFSEISLMFAKNPQGQYLGRITDLVFDSQGHISFAILSRPGIIGIHGKPIAVPFNALSFDKKEKVFILDVSWERLESAALFAKGDLGDHKWAEDTYRYFGQQPYWTDRDLDKEKDAARTPAYGRGAMSMAHGSGRLHEVTEILGNHVMNSQGEDLGRINDLVFDPEGRVSFAILAHGGFLRIGEKLIAIPFSSFSYEDKERHFVLDVTGERLESAPAFSKKTLGDLRWAEDVYRYFGQQPRWTEGHPQKDRGATSQRSMKEQKPKESSSGYDIPWP
jgi:sporulation protein YlmC with PRC-barrel domain